MTDDEIRTAFNHFQRQINHLAVITGQAIGALAFRDPVKRADIDHLLERIASVVM